MNYDITGTKTNWLRTALEEISAENQGTIEGYVANEALSYDGPEVFFKDVLNHGCASGMVKSLIYHTDTHAFFDRYYNEIEEIRQDYEVSSCEPVQINGDLKNFFAWFAFEQTAFKMASKLGIDF